jgi:hypothetical protein
MTFTAKTAKAAKEEEEEEEEPQRSILVTLYRAVSIEIQDQSFASFATFAVKI